MFKNIDLISITFVESKDYSKSSNGGDYSFWNEYRRTSQGWEEEQRSSADFSYCPRGMGFQDCNRCSMYYHEEGECMEEAKVLSDQEMAAKIAGRPQFIRKGYNHPEMTVLDVDASGK